MPKYPFSQIDNRNFASMPRLENAAVDSTASFHNKGSEQNFITSSRRSKFWPISLLDFLINRVIDSKISLELVSKFGRQFGKEGILASL